jgi:glycerol dehydrogenase
MALAIGRSSYDTLRADAVTALDDCSAGRVSDAVERVVEAVVLMSGLAFENGGLSLAHSLTRGLMRVEGARDLLHGYHVAWGALVQVQAEGRGDDAVLDLAGFLSSVGLPTCSADLGLSAPWDEQHRVIARYTMTAPHLANLPVAVDEVSIIDAIAQVDSLMGADAR